MDDNQLQELWEEYAFFTREMVKFFKKNDVDMFLTLQAEQEELYQKIRTVPEDTFSRTLEGQQLKQKIYEELETIKKDVQAWLNNARNKQIVANSYDYLGKSSTGQLRNWNG